MNFLFQAFYATLIPIMLHASAHADGTRQDATPLIPERWEEVYENWGFAPALRYGDEIWVSGLIVRPVGPGTYEERYRAGLRVAFMTLEEILAEEGATLDDILEMTSFHIDLPQQLPVILEERQALMNEPHPAWTAVGATALAAPDGLTEIKFYVRLSTP